MSADYPREVRHFHKALARLPGVYDVCSGIESLAAVREADLGLVEHAHLPHAALRRTGGGFPDEAFIQVEFCLEQEEWSWRSLEFLAWFVRDCARGGDFLQLRPFALPPRSDDQIQM